MRTPGSLALFAICTALLVSSANALASIVWRLDGDGMTEGSIGWNEAVEMMATQLSPGHTNVCIKIEIK